MSARIEDEGRHNVVSGPGTTALEDVRLIIKGNNNKVELKEGIRFAESCSLRVEGDGNEITIGEGVSFHDMSRLLVQGNQNRVVFGDHVSGRVRLHVETTGAQFDMGEGSTIIGGNFSLQEPRRLLIGRDCMFSAGVWVGVSDMHAIFDMDTGERLNLGGDVVIGDHVWVGMQAKVLKGVTVGSGSVIGTASIATSDIPENCLAAGTPARVLRERIRWTREMEGKTPFGLSGPYE